MHSFLINCYGPDTQYIESTTYYVGLDNKDLSFLKEINFDNFLSSK